MFRQQKHWNTGVIRHKGRELEIEISPPKDIGSEIGLVVTALLMLCGYTYLLATLVYRGADLIVLAIFAVPFGIIYFVGFRSLAEQQFASQIVLVKADTIQWTRKTRLWKRQRNLNLNDVEDISAPTGWIGFGTVRVTTTRGRQHTMLYKILNEDATRFARELKTAVRDHRT